MKYSITDYKTDKTIKEFNTINKIKIWIKENNIIDYLYSITEYDEENIDEDDCPEIVETMSLEEFIYNNKV